jgi:hypothetical protein
MGWLDDEVKERINNLGEFANQLVTNIVWRPGGTAGGVVFTSFELATEAAQLAQGMKTIQCDNSVVSGVITSASGDAFTDDDDTTILTDASGPFTDAMLGQSILIALATSSANNGTYLITEVISATQVRYSNAAGVTESANVGVTTWSLGTVCMIPPGVWNMLQTELTSYFTGAAANSTIAVTVMDGASFTGLRKIGGELTITNLNSTVSPVVLPALSIFEFGSGSTGDYPTLVNTGAAPFFDVSACIPAGFLRMCGAIGGANPSIGFGAAAANFVLTMFPLSQIATGAISGSHASAVIAPLIAGSSAQFNRQTETLFAGTVNHGLAGNAPIGAGMPWLRTWMVPRSLNQLTLVPSTAALAVPNLGLNTTMLLNTTSADIDQVLPLIRVSAPAANLVANTAGALNSTGMLVMVKNLKGANDVNLFGNTALATQTAAASDAFSLASTTVTLTDDSGPFTSAMDKRAITVVGATSAANDGTFILTYISATQVSYINAAGVAEAASIGVTTWTIGDTIDLVAKTVSAPLVVAAGEALILQSDGVSNWVVVGGF